MHPAPPAPPLVLIDAAHGGTDDGALLNPAIPEKDVTLMFAQHLQQQLGQRGISAGMVRDGDLTLSTDQRAGEVNSERPLLYLCIHASSLGNGVRLYAAMLPAGSDNRGPFVNWQTAQAASEPRSAWAELQITASLRKIGFPVRALIAPLRPLNNIAGPALAIEVAPSNGNVMQLASTDYQSLVGAALATAIAPLAPSLRSPSFGSSSNPGSPSSGKAVP